MTVFERITTSSTPTGSGRRGTSLGRLSRRFRQCTRTGKKGFCKQNEVHRGLCFLCNDVVSFLSHISTHRIRHEETFVSGVKSTQVRTFTCQDPYFLHERGKTFTLEIHNDTLCPYPPTDGYAGKGKQQRDIITRQYNVGSKGCPAHKMYVLVRGWGTKKITPRVSIMYIAHEGTGINK